MYDNALYFAAAADGDDYGLWRYVASQDEVELVADVNPAEPGLPPQHLTVYAGRLFFTVEELLDTGVLDRLWAYDAVDGTSVSVAALDVRSPLVVYDGRLFFAAHTEAAGSALWAYDADTDTVAPALVDPLMEMAADFVVYDERLFFRAYAPETGYELWAFDAATSEASLAADINSTGDSYPNGLTVYNGRLFFAARDGGANEELWRYDAATGTADLVADITPPSNPNGSFPRNLTVYDGRLFFGVLGDNYDRELWVYDGVTGEASFVADASGSELGPMIVLDGALFFRTSTNSENLAMYSATTDAVVVLAEGIHPLALAAYDGRLFFSGHDASGQDAYGRELWAYIPPSTASEPMSAPGSRPLLTAYPNPTLGSATVGLTVAESSEVRLAVYDVLGREVVVLHEGPLAAGAHALAFDAAGLPAGLYLVRAVGDGFTEAQRVTVVR